MFIFTKHHLFFKSSVQHVSTTYWGAKDAKPKRPSDSFPKDILGEGDAGQCKRSTIVIEYRHF